MNLRVLTVTLEDMVQLALPLDAKLAEWRSKEVDLYDGLSPFCPLSPLSKDTRNHSLETLRYTRGTRHTPVRSPQFICVPPKFKFVWCVVVLSWGGVRGERIGVTRVETNVFWPSSFSST